ncbi:hypothetical protein N8T08_009529 [Aspergillus melleus]|uniref:Uncharacterized protein n=1 Tax=Aspergillus melleus TaxID=138277 RepID=A0ACC3BD22_9EURO|nr:hypothetical protein N8T08_009529 [Aspergillus melleus]
METFGARLASFDRVLQPEKRRGSSAKAAKSIAWPHRRPSPAELAHAGFFYNPYETNPDNTTCFLCRRALDGWEEEDNSITEHLKHSPDCGWALMMDIQQHSSNPAEIEDPTSDPIRQARLATFGGKKKGSRSKKARTSKVSRQSTQSTISEAPVSDVDVIDPPTMSQSSTKPKTTKKSSKPKTKTSKSKKTEAGPIPTEMEIDDSEQADPEAPQPKRPTRGKKRASGEIDPDQEDSGVANTQEVEHSEAPTKKKAKKSRESAQKNEQEDVVIAEAHQEDVAQEAQEQEEPKKARSTSKKKTSAKSRKASSASSTAKPSVHPEEHQEVDMYAALEAELDNPEPVQPTEEVEQKPAKKLKSKKKKKDASPEPSVEDVPQVNESHPDVPQETEPTGPPAPEEPAQPKTKRESTKREKSKGRSSTKRVTEETTEPTKPTEPAPQPTFDMDDGSDIDVSRHESFVSVEIPNRLPEQDPPADSSDKATKKKQKQKSSLDKTKKPKKTSKTAPEPVQSIEEPIEESNVEEQVQPQEILKPQESPDAQKQEPDPKPTRRRSSRVPPKTAERYSDIPEEKQLAKSLAGSRSSNARAAPEEYGQRDEPEAVSPIPSASKSSPSPSPQSSDAENRPPSMKPSASRPVAASPSKQPTLRVPLAPSTPSPSKRTANTGGLNTSCPWKPVDIDEILLAGNSDKENVDITTALSSVKGDLTSPEKKMTVEQWITWNAKNGEERLRRECERIVGQFEKEGARAMRVLEGIECTD